MAINVLIHEYTNLMETESEQARSFVRSKTKEALVNLRNRGILSQPVTCFTRVDPVTEEANPQLVVRFQRKRNPLATGLVTRQVERGGGAKEELTTVQETLFRHKRSRSKKLSRPIIVKSVNYNVFIVENAARIAV